MYLFLLSGCGKISENDVLGIKTVFFSFSHEALTKEKMISCFSFYFKCVF